MHGVLVEKINEPERAASSLLAEIEDTATAVRQRAFDFYRSRGGISGSDLDDWLRAERELIWTPRAEMTESDEEVTLRVDAAGLEARNLRVTATPNAILIRADAGHNHDQTEGRLCFCDFGERLFRQFEFQQAIDVERVTATLDKGILEITATKRSTQQSRNVPVVAQATH
jgi:HSP20 family molecular chaperone IbpA